MYLLIGVLVAFSGLGFFYLQTTKTRPGGDSAALLLALAPQFGILFFIEFIAFFFLRQYRSAMDEFRYYESIQRRREELFAAIRLLRDGNKDFDVLQLLKDQHFYSTAEKLAQGETTELLETRKLEKSELELVRVA